MGSSLPHHERLAMAKGYRWRLGWKLVTLTMPHPPGADTLDQLRLFNAAFRMFTKRPEWAIVWGGCKGVEDKLTADGPHVHAHFLLLARYLDRQAWREAWKTCLDGAAARLGWALTYGPDGLPYLDVQRVVKRDGGVLSDEVSWSEALNEVAKYITKPAELLASDERGRRIPSWVLYDLCEIARWPRMFELLGRARTPPVAQAPKGPTRLDTSCISAAEGLGDVMLKAGKWVQGSLGLDECERTTLILGGEGVSGGEASDPDPPPDAKRPASWREMMGTHSLEAWLAVVGERVVRGARFRLNWLRTFNPRLYLVDMTGRVRANQNCYADMVD